MNDFEGEDVFDLIIINVDEEELFSSRDGKTFLYGFVWRNELNQKCLLQTKLRLHSQMMNTRCCIVNMVFL